MDFSKIIDDAFNMDFDCKLDDCYYNKNVFENLDISDVDPTLVIERSRHERATNEYFCIYAYSKDEWSVYESIKALYYIAFIQLKFTELEILDQLYDKRRAAVACEKIEHFFYPAMVVWKTRTFLLTRCELDKVAHNLFENRLIARPEPDKDMFYYGKNICYNMKMILSASKFLHKIPIDDLGYFKNLIEMTVEVLENVSIKVCDFKE